MSDDGERTSITQRFDWSAISPTSAVIELVTTADERVGEELPPLAATVDPGALNDLFAPERGDDWVRVSFSYAGYDVTIASDGTVSLADA